MKIEEEIHQSHFRNELQKASLNLLFTSGWLSNRHKESFKPYGITPQQYNVLRILRGSLPKTISTSEIKARMLDRNSDVSRIVDRLNLKGWIIKKPCPADRRLVDVTITEKGLNLLTEMDTKVEMLENSLGKLSEEEANRLNQLLDKIRY